MPSKEDLFSGRRTPSKRREIGHEGFPICWCGPALRLRSVLVTTDRLLEKALALSAIAAIAGGEALSWDGLKRDFRNRMEADPIDTTLSAIAVASVVFYLAEKGHNPKVETISDALEFVSTGISVGYSDIFPRTEVGKLISTACATFGPAMAAALLEPFRGEKPEDALLNKLDEILTELRAQRS